jgi:hypothetical protein
MLLTLAQQNSWSQENIDCISWAFIPTPISLNKTYFTQLKPAILMTRSKIFNLENWMPLVVSCHYPTPLIAPFSTT